MKTWLMVLLLPWLATYYVSTSGASGNTGTRDNPKNVGWVESNLSAGDSAIFLDGTYNENLNPTVSGTSGDEIVYIAENRYGVTFETTDNVIQLTGQDYLWFEGFLLNATAGRPIYFQDGSDWNGMRYCRTNGGHNDAGQGYYEANYIWSNYNRFYHVYFDRDDPDTIGINENWNVDPACLYRIGDAVTLNQGHYNIFESDTFTRASHGGIALAYGNSIGNVIRDCYAFDLHTGMGAEGGSRFNLFEGNKVWGSGRRLQYQEGHVYQFGLDSSQIRFNVGSIDTTDYGTVTDVKKYQANQYLSLATGNPSRDTRSYRNTFLARTPEETRQKHVIEVVKQEDAFSGHAFVANILASPVDGYCIEFVNTDIQSSAFTERYENNRFHMLPEGNALDTVLRVWTSDLWESESYLLSAAQSTYSGWDNNTIGTPQFTDSVSRGANRNYTLASSSPCVNAAIAPTLVNGAVTNNTNVVVDDALWFHYNMGGNPFDRGDSIWFKGSGVKAEIDSIHYPSNTLILRAQVTVDDNDSVHIWKTYRSRDASWVTRIYDDYPDIGAMELYTQSSGKLDYTIAQINGLLKRVNDSLAAHYQKKDMNIGFTYHDLNDSMVACTVWDVDKDGDLDPELQNGINMGQAHAWGFVVNVEGGKYLMTNGLNIDGRMRWKYLHGNRTRLMWPAGFTGNYFTIAPDGEATSNNHDLNNFRMEGFVCETNEWPYSQDCNGLVINPLTNGDVVHSIFKDLNLMGCKVGILIQADSVNCGAGEHDWINSNHFQDIVIISPDTPMVVRSKPAPTHVGRNTFSTIAVQTSEAAGGGLTRYGFYFDGGFGNRMAWCDMWDNQALTTKIPPLAFKGNARDNLFFGGSLEAVSSGAGQVVDEGTNNVVFGFQVQPDSTGPKWLNMRVADYIGGAKLAGASSFTGTDQRKAVYIPGATSTDVYTVAPSQDAAPGANDILSCYAKTDSLIVWRPASGTSGLGFNWLRLKK